MSEAVSTASTLAASLSGEESSSDTTEPILEEAEAQVDSTEEVTEETAEEALPENIKDILSKNRKAVREAEARAVAAEKALAAKDKAPETEEAPAEPIDDKFKKLFVNSAAKSALVEAGLTTGTDRFLRMLDFDSVEVDENGTISGLKDQIDGLKDEFKDLISPKEAPKKPVARVDGAGRRETPVTQKTSAEKLAEQVRGGRQ